MKAKNISLRLKTAADYVVHYGNKPIRLADIGSDHAYLPINLVLENEVEFAIAGEIADGPLKIAQRAVEDHQLTDRISVRKGDGLDVVLLEDQMNVIAVCGMGGTLIRQILDRGTNKLPKGHLLVLQPNIDEDELRSWLNNHHYYIVDETIMREHGHDYEFIIALHKPDSEKQLLSDREILFGPILSKHQDPLFKAKWHRKLAKLNEIIESMQQSKSLNYDKLKVFETHKHIIEKELADND